MRDLLAHIMWGLRSGYERLEDALGYIGLAGGCLAAFAYVMAAYTASR